MPISSYLPHFAFGFSPYFSLLDLSSNLSSKQANKKNKMLNKINPIVILFAILSALLLIAGKWLSQIGFDVEFLIGTNIFIFILSLITMFMQTRALHHSNPNVFVRAVMGSMLLKMMVCLIAVLVYISLIAKEIDKKGLFSFMFIYFTYLFVEVKSIMSRNKRANA